MTTNSITTDSITTDSSTTDSTSRTTTETLICDIGQAMADGRWIDVLANVAPHVVAHVAGVGDLEGVDALAGFLADTEAKTDDGEHLELLDTLVGTDYAALYFRITAIRQGRPPLDNLTLHLARFEHGQIVEIWFHNFDAAAVAAFWA